MTLSDLVTNTAVVFPLVVLIAWACALLLVDLLIPMNRKSITALLAALGLLLSMGLTIINFGRTAVGFSDMVIYDGYSFFLNILFLASGLAGIALAYDYIKRMGIERGEYYALLLFSTSGMMLM